MNTPMSYYIPVYYPIEIFNHVMVQHNFPNVPQPIVFPPTTVIPEMIPCRQHMQAYHKNQTSAREEPPVKLEYEIEKKPTIKVEQFSEGQAQNDEQEIQEQNSKLKKKKCIRQNTTQRTQNETRNVNSNILKNFFKVCLRDEALNIRRICELNDIDDQKFFLRQFKKRVNTKEHYVKTSSFMKMLNEKSDFGKILRVLLRKYAKTECINAILISSRLKPKQKELHMNHRFDVINQVLP